MIVAATLTACNHESLEDKAEREAREFTEKFCPTPANNGVVTDSLVFDKTTNTFKNYYTFVDELDDSATIATHAEKFRQFLVKQTHDNTRATSYKDAGYIYQYIYRSQKSGKEMLKVVVTKKDYE